MKNWNPLRGDEVEPADVQTISVILAKIQNEVSHPRYDVHKLSKTAVCCALRCTMNCFGESAVGSGADAYRIEGSTVMTQDERAECIRHWFASSLDLEFSGELLSAQQMSW